MKVMIVVTHLLGSGHLARAITLSRAFVAGGHTVTLVSGGRPIPHLDTSGFAFEQLSPVASNGTDFSTLLDRHGNSIDAAFLAQRTTELLSKFDAHEPDILITELFPFGRRILKEEFVALLEQARARRRPPLIVSSIRDILAPPSKPAKAELAAHLISRFFDTVLVHADAAVTPLELSWPVDDLLRKKLHYTGFVALPTAPPHPQNLGRGEVLVSAGGGDVGARVFATACAAAALDHGTWRLLIGGSDATEKAIQLQKTAPANVIVEAARPDFRQMLHHARASVSMCGYNTAMDILQSKAPAVLIPFDDGNEVEQTIRAKALSAHPDIAVVRNSDLNAKTLVDALHHVESAPRRENIHYHMNGADESVAYLTELWRRTHAD